MKQLLIPLSAVHYFKTRRFLWVKFLIAIIPAITVWLCFRFIGIKVDAITGKPVAEFSTVFSDFVNVQISAVAILISFSIAIITILVSAENSNIKKLRETASSDCKPLGNKPLSLFQVLLSNITYNVLIEVVYLGFLILCIFAQIYFGEEVFKWLMAISVFFIVHILHILLESVGQMYCTFLKNADNN